MNNLSRTNIKFKIVSVTVFALAVTSSMDGYAQTYSAGQSYNASQFTGQTEVEKTVGKCAAAVVGGAIGGAVLGSLFGGRRNAGAGAIGGAAAGAGLCAIMMSIASEHDKARLRQAQLDAMNSGQAVREQWRTDDGKVAAATVTPTSVVQVPEKTTGETINCRRANTQLSVNGQITDSSDVVCLHGDSWVTLDKLRSLGVDVGDVSV